MNIQPFYTKNEDGLVITQQQGSDFAKNGANDFNPAHDPGTKTYCHPGDLLLAILAHEYGLNEHTAIKFNKPMKDSTPFSITHADGRISVSNTDRIFIDGTYSGKNYAGDGVMELVQAYIKFSGKVFPDTLVHLLKDEGLMIDADRPFVVYNSMSIEIDKPTEYSQGLELQLSSTNIEISKGTRALVTLNFDFTSQTIGSGKGNKTIQLLGLKSYEQSGIDSLIESYNSRKNLT